jgi:hypothetical protein
MSALTNLIPFFVSFKYFSQPVLVQYLFLEIWQCVVKIKESVCLFLLIRRGPAYNKHSRKMIVVHIGKSKKIP